MTILETDRLCRRYGSRRGIQNVSIRVGEGEIFGFLGPNGAGKSTTIRVLMGLLQASSGTAQLFGRDCWTDGAEVRRQVGYVAGDVRLYSWLTLNRGLKFLSQVRGASVVAAGKDLADRFQLEPDLPVRKMSRGNRQKLALVLALAHRPRLVILDEPTSGLDPLMQDTLMLCLREMAVEGHTVVFSSHTLSEVESLCDHIAIIRSGEIVQDASLQELKAAAPRRIVVTLPDNSTTASGASAGIQWPESVRVLYTPSVDFGGKSSVQDSSSLLLIPPGQRHRTCVLEVHGSGVPFMQWAATRNFEDVVIGPPSLDALFRKYYQT